MRLVPRSLFSRVVLVLLSGLIVAQLLSLGIHLRERGELLYRASGVQSAQRIADIVKLLDSLAPAERRKIAAIFNAPPLFISLDKARLKRQGDNAERGGQAIFFRAVLRRFLGDEWPMEVMVSENPAHSPRIAGPAFQSPHMTGSGPPFGPGMHYFAAPGLSFVAQVRLHDGTWVTFEARQPADTSSWPYRLMLSLLILLVTVIALTLIAARWVTRPLNALADAAEELGRNIDRPPLAENGPLEVARAAHAFNSMQQRLKRYIQDRTRVLAAMSHDLKTPITRLRLRAELLDDGELKKKFSRDLEEMEAMVGAALDFMRGMETGEQAQPLDIMALLDSLQADAQETGGDITIKGSASGPYAGRPQALKRCLRNLIDNAVKYGTSATITVDDSPDRLLLRIQDRGPGIPEAELERVFEPFYRVEASRSRETGGTGLGLSIARNVAQLHGGTLVLRNITGGGLEAVLTLPRPG